jgi:hypothetical protein
VERKRQYKEIMDKESKEWQDRNSNNIIRLLKKKDTSKLWGGTRMMTQVSKQRRNIDPLRAKNILRD